MAGAADRICDWCKVARVNGRYREITGIEEIRSQGGANKIIGRRETGRQPCQDCARKIAAGLNPGQGRML
jgi:hypothetical protein